MLEQGTVEKYHCYRCGTRKEGAKEIVAKSCNRSVVLDQNHPWMCFHETRNGSL